jgi:superfamily II DNA or RNA helicase
MAGRVLRAASGKTDALLLDLSGVTWDLGLPHEDREYSLDGMRRKPGAESLRVCQQCGYTETSGVALCTRCGFKLPPKDLRPKVTGEEIGEHSQLEKDLRLSALLAEAKRKGYADDWVSVQFRKLTGCEAKFPHDVERKMLTYEKFKAAARASGYSMAYAESRFKALYGAYPPRGW